MKKVITVGVFDLFHLGHFNLLKHASTHGDNLIVGVHDDKLNTKGVDFLYSLEERLEIIEALKFVYKSLPYERVDLFLEKNEFDVFVHGPDQNHQYFQKAIEYCKKNGKGVVELSRTDGISSSDIRDYVSERNV